MTRIIKARFANGVLTPLEPLDMGEDTEVMLTIEELPAPPVEEPQRPFRVKPISRGFAPGFDPASLKDFLCEMDDEEFWRKHNS